MPRFFFHLNNSHGWTCDEEGQELDGVESALETAFAKARALISADVESGVPIKMCSYVAIVHEAGDELGRVGYDETMTIDHSGTEAPDPKGD